jgi:hypothetical protein
MLARHTGPAEGLSSAPAGTSACPVEAIAAAYLSQTSGDLALALRCAITDALAGRAAGAGEEPVRTQVQSAFRGPGAAWETSGFASGGHEAAGGAGWEGVSLQCQPLRLFARLRKRAVSICSGAMPRSVPSCSASAMKHP